MVIGLVKIILILWIANAAYRWYLRSVAAQRRPNSATGSAAHPESNPMHSGRIVDAEFEEMDSGADQSR